MNWNFISRHRHYGATISIAALAAGAILHWMPLSGPLLSYANLIPTAVVLLGVSYQLSHKHNLCEQCIDGLSLDAAGAAERKKPWLRFAHLVNDSPRRLATMSVVLLTLMVSGRFLPHAFGAAAMTLNALLMGTWIWAGVVHGRYQPWCPWCHGDDDGEDEHAITPDPAIFA